MRVEEFDYDLPREMIAQHPSGEREASRLLACDRAKGTMEHRRFSDIAGYLREGDVLVINDSKVFPARLRARKKTGGHLDILLVRSIGDGTWECLARGISKTTDALPVAVGGHDALLARSNGSWTISFASREEGDEVIGSVGRMPLPPYIKRNGEDGASDFDRYQTVYARKTGSIAAPTAGFHFSAELLERIAMRGVEIVKITLHIGIGTFSLIRPGLLEDHRMHAERYDLDETSKVRIRAARQAGRRVVACGTSSVRTLETVFGNDGNGVLAGETGLFIYPGYRFHCVDALITNFHLPRSTPLVLVAAFMGAEALKKAYAEAIDGGYRFYSYGDAMFIS
ncbi:MAG: tRNA preQ1(34) S-adenosylmethionine ribosyltransferase-isomerase QueA [Syntrophorhabdaceae bacterium]|nr:tRNA preQ1(34) S-adenosylmethionine ribosyltransferase-isomerase QueA [Syntrophorhabdaceae bacterium]